MRQPDDPGPFYKDEPDFRGGPWFWIASALAVLGIVGLVTLYSFSIPLEVTP